MRTFQASRLLFALLIGSALLPPSPARAAEWELARQSPPESLGPGIAALVKSVRRSTSTDAPARTIRLILFDKKNFRLKIIDQGDTKPGRHQDLAEAMRQNFCIAGCNGGFFHPDFRPAGLVIADGVRINRFENAKLLSGVLLADKNGPRILRRKEFRDHEDIDQLLQSGPFLVDGGRTVAGLSTGPARNRTFILTDDAGQWAIGTASSLSLADLGTILGDASILPEIRVTRALNLDGGSSTSLYFDRGAGLKPHHSRGFARVRNFVGVEPR